MTIQPVKFVDRLAYNINAKDYAKVANEVARRSENFAWELIASGVRGNATPKDVIRIANSDVLGMYEKTGELTEKGIKENIDMLMHMFDLKSEEQAKKITIKQFINKWVKDSNKMQ